MNRESTIAVVQRIYEMFGKGDIPAVLGCIDPNGELVFEGPSAVPWAGRYQGRDGWGVFFQRIGGNLDILGMTMEIFAAEKDNVVAVGRYQARVKATGKTIDSPLVHLWTVRNGLVVKCHETTNTSVEAAACA